MVEKQVFLMKPKHQNHFSQQGKRVYSAQSSKETILLSESMFIPIERRMSILKMVEKQVFFMKSMHQNHLSQWGEYEYGAQSWKERRLFCESLFIPIERRTWILKMVEKQVFLMKPKHRNHLSQQGECDYGAQSWKERRLLCESMFIPIERRTWILKMVEKQVFLMKSKHPNRLSR